MNPRTSIWTAERKDRALHAILAARASVAEAYGTRTGVHPEVESWLLHRLEKGCAPLLAVWALCAGPARPSTPQRLTRLALEHGDVPRRRA